MIEEIFEKALRASKENRLEEAENLYKECLKIHQTPEVWNNLGNVYARMERYAEAIECYRRSIDCDPTFTIAHTNLASLLINLERFAEARLVLLSLLNKEQPNEQTLAMLIVCDLALNNLAEAVSLYKKNASEALNKELSEYGVLEKLLELS
ncbi:tetratricopeptide repeat protein [Pseudothermotoga sp.]|uniref:tetratricopeptide repeat protein n=1 Tax=Pseudothermotoga sp. TaxID=2033661 RepID=UPI002996D8F3|nr:tetratricopeptide repeat protein [Pseudothermotoga sp.]MCX7813523.1 tetratricopeptide repeat protein [Pseudothermotoga sp.]MDW8140556.1 tetratricopeptide repeat protein [Pseudothermotoga sp.]